MHSAFYCLSKGLNSWWSCILNKILMTRSGNGSGGEGVYMENMAEKLKNWASDLRLGVYTLPPPLNL